MKYKIVGSNRSTGARVTMELDANNRAIAERKAAQAGMEVLHVEQMAEPGEIELEAPPRATRRGEFIPESYVGRRIAIFIVLAGLIVAAFFLFGHIRALMGR